MRILVVHQQYLLPGQPGGSRFNDLARLWSAAGHEVEVIAGSLNYVTGQVPERLRGRWSVTETDGPVTVQRCHVPASYRRSYAGRMWAFLGFTLSASSAALRARPPDVVIASSPPLVAVIPGFLAARCRSKAVPWVFEVRDLWPESAITTGVIRTGSPLARSLYALEGWACSHADRIAALTPAFAEDIVRRGLAPRSQIVLTPNGADVERFSPGPGSLALRQKLGWDRRFVVLYAGAHGRANAVGQLVEAAELLRAHPHILIATVGDGPERSLWQDEARRRALDNIQFLGPVAKEDMPELIRAADVGAAVLQRNPTFHTVYPNKVFDYMACGRPTLVAIDGVARELVCDQARAGVFAEPEDAASLASAILALAADPGRCAELGRNGREWVLAHASRSALAEQYLATLRDLHEKPRPAAWDRPVQRAAKALLDRLLAALGLVALSPLLLAIALLVRLSLGRPVLFRQRRPGYHGLAFEIAKFRTMQAGTGSDTERLTALGRLLRATSLDELPELWNVLKGEMSLVGPRPLLMDYLDRYSPAQLRRHEMRPGITGWAQVRGRNALSWEERFALDVWYVDHWSLGLDLRILGLTAWKVLTREGISAAGEATMPEFRGSPDAGSKA